MCFEGARVSQSNFALILTVCMHCRNKRHTIRTSCIWRSEGRCVLYSQMHDRGLPHILGKSLPKSKSPVASTLYSLPFLGSAACLAFRHLETCPKKKKNLLYLLILLVGCRNICGGSIPLPGHRDLGRAIFRPSKSFCPCGHLHPKCKLKLSSLQRDAFCLRIFKHACQVRAHHR